MKRLTDESFVSGTFAKVLFFKVSMSHAVIKKLVI